jgi:hypothetical protein
MPFSVRLLFIGRFVGLPPIESVSIWGYINGEAPESPRTEIVLDHHMFSDASAMNGTCGGQVSTMTKLNPPLCACTGTGSAVCLYNGRVSFAVLFLAATYILYIYTFMYMYV